MAVPAFQRLHRGYSEVEDASVGKLGPEFQDAGCLLISEVHLFFSRPGEVSDRETGQSACVYHAPNESVTQKTKEYAEEFSRFKDQSTIREVRALLIKHAAQPDMEDHEEKGLQLSQFEMAQLANLSITDVDEARTLIPTLASKDDTQLESLLHELAAIQKFA
ncbi:rpb4-16 kd subunit of dna-directed rna polymerase ii [Malassezia pachydermatis]|uniref:Rpb4-16 kd subunit of dna-directed rna polymerase ii n=1 Tax=Malassezia pachydermatis TaxID=77020 RepID=A0A0M9VQX1_9BASI|nr:rpb4-16 kd subunit of dna-directed rna polymerase ii [Malassezia pachydermatis]KOS16015.1 rpb4-16 kd subunit of dna-directed rna polymerase ii [Malassezia pachydermatis]